MCPLGPLGLLYPVLVQDVHSVSGPHESLQQPINETFSLLHLACVAATVPGLLPKLGNAPPSGLFQLIGHLQVGDVL